VRSLKKIVVSASLLVLIAPVAALAGHGKAGLWQVTTTLSMPSMPNMAPQSNATTRCMTADEVASDGPAKPESPDCQISNVSVSPASHSYSADMVCTGQTAGRGHLQTTYDSDTHYSGTMSFMMANGTAVQNNFEGKWMSADCAGAAH
jgi:hypothetical protein